MATAIDAGALKTSPVWQIQMAYTVESVHLISNDNI